MDICGVLCGGKLVFLQKGKQIKASKELPLPFTLPVSIIKGFLPGRQFPVINTSLALKNGRNMGPCSFVNANQITPFPHTNTPLDFRGLEFYSLQQKNIFNSFFHFHCYNINSQSASAKLGSKCQCRAVLGRLSKAMVTFQ